MKKFMVFLILLAIAASGIYSVPCEAKKVKKTDTEAFSWPKGPDLISESAVLMEVSTGTILYEKNSRQHNFPASITKIMTVLLCLENSDLNETVTFSQNAVFGIEKGSSNIGANVGEQLTMEQSLYSIMTASANEVSLGVAEHVSGSVAAFVDMMNERAEALGCKDTHFENPNGLHSDDHYTSAYDMGLIAREAIQNNTFRQITKVKRYVIPPTNKYKEIRYLPNHHEMINGDQYPKYQTDYVIGGKTGFTSKSKNTLVTYARKDGMELVCVVMRSAGPALEPNEYTDTRALFDYGYNNFILCDPATMETADRGNKNASILFTRFNPLFSETESPVRFQDSADIVLPKNVDYSKVKKTVTIEPDGNGDKTILGNVTYTYGNRQVGGSNVIYVRSNAPRLITDKPVAKVDSEALAEADTQKDLKPIIVCLILAAISAVSVLLYILVYRPRKLSRFTFAQVKRKSRTKRSKDLLHFK